MTPRVVAIRPSDSLATARELLRQHRIHHLLVIENDRVIGVLSYREVIGKADAVRVSDAMSRDVLTVSSWDTVRNAATKMIGRPHGCLPVVDGDRLGDCAAEPESQARCAARSRSS